MNLPKEASEKINELQMLEQTLQSYLAQKQNINLELNEVLNALNELNNYQGIVYKSISGILLETKKEDITKELEEKKKILELRISSIEKQEKSFEERADLLKKEIDKILSS